VTPPHVIGIALTEREALQRAREVNASDPSRVTYTVPGRGDPPVYLVCQVPRSSTRPRT
jgi:hypothetical protein